MLVVAAAAAVLALSACSSDAPATPTDPVLAEGQDIYNRQCASCHGTSGQGGVGASMEGVADRLTLDEHMATVANGREGTSMPAFKDRLTPEEIEAVSRYEREVL